jgi:hypothetical protein
MKILQARMRVIQPRVHRWVPLLYRANPEITKRCFPGTAAGRVKRGTGYDTTSVA